MNKISFAKKDEHLPQVAAGGNFNFETTNDFRVHGLVQADRPAILIEYQNTKIPAKQFEVLNSFFNRNKIKTVIQPCKDGGKHQIYIGLRADLRKDTKTMTAALNTIIYHLEGKMKLAKTKKVKCPSYE